MSLKSPNFILIGATKCGTTSLHQYLQQHPQIFMSRLKEPHFLVFAGRSEQAPMSATDLQVIPSGSVNTLGAYKKLFAQAPDTALVRGEASVNYLVFPDQVIPAIKQYTPAAKLVAILRHPAERAFSAYVHLVRSSRESIKDFHEVYRLAKKIGFSTDASIKLDNHNLDFYFSNGFYSANLSRYLQAFPSQQIKVFLYDDLKQDAPTTLQEICLHLEIDDTFKFDFSRRHNTAGWPRNEAINRVLFSGKMLPAWLRPGWGIRGRLQRLNAKAPPRFDPSMRQQLTEHYRQDILQLQDLIDRDLSHWLKSSS